ncbi:hypothetical protein BC826DRAFT_314409 [Russula brevipes]|nr:hypothetical protein BC826DRAFT_314409 [Russula brevipes]
MHMHRPNVLAYRGDISNRVPMSRFDDVPTALVSESRTCQAGHRPTGCETPSSALFNQIRFTGPLQLTRLGMSILSLYCTSYTCECILTVLKAIGRLDNGCDSRDFLFGRTIIDTKRRGGEGSGRISAASCLFASFGNLWSRRFRRPFPSLPDSFLSRKEAKRS